MKLRTPNSIMELDPEEFTRRVNELVVNDGYLKRRKHVIVSNLAIARRADKRAHDVYLRRRKRIRQQFIKRIRPTKNKMAERIKQIEAKIRKRMEFAYRRAFMRQAAVNNRANRYEQIRAMQADAKYHLPEPPPETNETR